MNIKPIFWVLAFALVMVSAVGCQNQDADPVAAAEVAEETTNERDNRDGLDATNDLVLGTLRLEGTTDAVTPEQAIDILPLWQIIQNGSLKSAAETEAVLTQIKEKMSETQLTTIEAMVLSNEDMQAWMEEQGIEMRAPQGDGQDGPGARSGTFQNISEDERAQMRDQFQNMSAEERATRMADMGIQRPEDEQGNGANPGMAGGGRRFNMLLAPLIDLLYERAVQFTAQGRD